jgi:hypothetical protein
MKELIEQYQQLIEQPMQLEQLLPRLCKIKSILTMKASEFPFCDIINYNYNFCFSREACGRDW